MVVAVSRSRALLVYGLTVVTVVGLFAVFIGFRDDAALVSALSAAGTVLAAGFAAIAAIGSMRSAAESSTAARRTREAFARTVRPRLQPAVARDGGTLHGRLECGAERAAIDVMVVWMLADSDAVTDRVARIEPGAAFTVDLKIPDTSSALDGVEMVWIEYWDDGRVGQWQETWRPDAEGPADAFVQSDATLVE
jgi:hypothetical protein